MLFPLLFEELTRPTQTRGIDMWEDEDGIKVKMELPGHEKGNISVAREGRTLTITAKRSPEEKDGRRYIYCSCSTSETSQSILLPRDCGEETDAEYNDGILIVSVPKSPKAKARNVVIR